MILPCLAFPVAAGAAQDQAPGKDPEFADTSQDVIVYGTLPSSPQAPTPRQVPLQPATQHYDHLDIRSVRIGNESLEELEFFVQLATTVADPATFVVGTPAAYSVYFVFHDVPYRASSATLSLDRFEDGQQQFVSVDALAVAADVATNTIRFTVPKDAIMDLNRSSVRQGDVLESFYVHASADVVWAPFTIGFGGGVGTPSNLSEARDRAPDQGFGASYTIKRGAGTDNGHLQLFAPVRNRLSNGGHAANFVYSLQLTNTGEQSDVATIMVRNVSADWSARAPPRIAVPAQKTVEFPVVLTVDAAHRHGETAIIVVRAESSRVAGVFAEANLGVAWTAIPQPAGHHDRLWLHSGGAGTWMNALDDDPSAGASATRDRPVNPTLSFSDGPAPTTWQWNLPLSPRLLIGLDFDPTRTGSLQAEFESASAVAFNQLEVVPTLDYCDPNGDPTAPTATFHAGPCGGGWITLARGRSDSFSVPGNGKTAQSTTLRLLPVADYIPYRKGANLELVVQLVSSDPSASLLPATPALAVNTSILQLPLFEFNDLVDASFLQMGDLSLKSVSPYEKIANPGRTAVFEFAIANRGDARRTLNVELEGAHQDWARIGPSSQITLGPRQSRPILVAVHVPDGTPAGELADFVVVASDAQESAVGRLRVLVTTDQDVPDEASSFSSSGGSKGFAPGIPVAWLIAGLASFALAKAFRTRRFYR